MNDVVRIAAIVLAVALAPSAIAQGGTAPIETSIEAVRDCRPLGEVLGESAICSKTRAKRDAVKQAVAIGATHMIYTNVRCVFGAGEKASARIYDCASRVDLTKSIENYLEADPTLEGQTVAATTPAQIMSSEDLDVDGADLTARGYKLIGYAGTTGAAVPMAVIKAKAAEMGAAVVLLRSVHTGDDVEYQSVTSYSRGGASIGYGFGSASGSYGGTYGSANVSGTTISSNPGSTATQAVPYSQRRYDTQILLWRKRKPGPLGLYVELIPAQLRASLGRNTGAFVVGVEDESPAFFADIVAGDVVVSVDDVPVRTPTELATRTQGRAPGPIRVTILRNGRALNLTIQ